MIDQHLYHLTGRKVRLWLSSDEKGSFLGLPMCRRRI